jgi:hypothetical protein
MTRAQHSLLAGRSNVELSEVQVRKVTNTFLGLDRNVPSKYDADGHTRFVVEIEEEEEVGWVYFGRDIYPGTSVLDPNSALSMTAAVAHEICHYHRWQDRTELPLGVHRHLDEALTSLDAALRFSGQLSSHEIQQLIRDAMQRLQLHHAELAAPAPETEAASTESDRAEVTADLAVSTGQAPPKDRSERPG